MRRLSEKYWPITITLVLTGLFIFFFDAFEDPDDVFDKTLGNSLTISGTLIGFFLTILTIISTITTRRMQFVKEAGLYPKVQAFLSGVISWHLINISLILFEPVLDALINTAWAERVFQGVMIFIVIFSWALSIRFTVIFIMLLKEK